MKKLINKSRALMLALIVGFIITPSAFAAATVVIENGDPAGVGFNDPTPVLPIGGNGGTTLGQQRLNAFQFAADVWGATLTSGPTITVHATWEALTCTSTTAVLGSAGAATIRRNFSNAPFMNTWYGAALANSIAAADSNPAAAEINARFNVNIGNTGCLENRHWYLGLDSNHGGDIDLVSVLLHEFGHGLGFQTFTSSSTGVQNSGFPSIYDKFLFDNSTGKTWDQMTDAERVASAVNTNQLAWNGPQVSTDALGVLGNPRLRINSPPPIAGNYQVGTADFGPSLSSPGIAANVVEAIDPADGAGASTTDGCSALTNAGAIAGKIALIDRGTCTFIVKVKNAQNAGAIGVVIADNVAGTPPPGLGGSDPTIIIPAVRITQADGTTIKSQLASGVNATLLLDSSSAAGTDAARRPLLFTPNPVESGSSVSHWDSSAFPNQLMEPNISGNLSHSVTVPQDLTASLFKDIGWTITGVSPPSTPTLQLSASSFSTGEGGGHVAIDVTRSNTAAAATVDFATSDTFPISSNCQSASNGVASSRCDYATTLGTLNFAVGDATETIIVPIVDDNISDGNEAFTITLSNPTGASLGTSTATVTITENANGAGNPVDSDPFFVNQHYIDLLGRLPDQGGYNAWLGILSGCGTTVAPPCDKIEVSSAFFRSEEFQSRGYFVYRLYSTVGTIPGYDTFMPDFARVSGFLSEQQKEANKVALVNDFTTRPAFTTKYGALTAPTDYVDGLLQTVGFPNHTQRNAWISALQSGSLNRAQVFRQVAETTEVYNKYYNEAFVIMQYFGYLRRSADISYLLWIQEMNTNGGNYRTMINGFLNSAEYRQRFGP